MTQQTKLSAKMRALAARQHDNEKGAARTLRLNDHANRLDRAMFSGTVTREHSVTYRQARLAYCEANGRGYEWGAENDLEMIDRA